MMSLPSSGANQSTGESPLSTHSPSEGFVDEPQASQIFRIVFFSLTTVVSLLGNSIMLKAAREYPSRKPVSYLLVTNLAVAELISTIAIPFSFVYVHLRRWVFGEFACKITNPLQVLSLFVVTNTLAAIAGYRFFFIAFQLRVNQSYNRICLFLALLWLTAFAVTMPMFIFRKIEGELCVVDFYDRVNYEIVRLVLNFGLPYLIMILSYAAVAYKLKRHIKRNVMETMEMSKREEASKQESDAGDRARETRRRSSRTMAGLENDLLKMIYAIIIVFAVCYLPYQVQFLFHGLGGYQRYPEAHPYSRIIQSYCFLLTNLSSALHPICYGTMNRFYARVFSRIVLCHCKSSE